MTTFHFVGIKGTGMSALAQILHDMKKRVQGSDVNKYFFTQKALEERNIPILPFNKTNIQKDQIVIAGNAFDDHHEEISEARARDIPVYRYHQFLGDFMRNFISIGVAGSHGKTSTTGLLAHVLSNAKQTSFLIGDGSGKGTEGSEYFVFEACEYKRHFLAYHPDYALMTNIDFDHPDYFSDVDDVFQAFQQMAMQVKKAIIAYGDDSYLQKIQANVPVLFYGLNEENDFQATNIQADFEGTTFDVFVRNTFYGSFQIPMHGNHNVANALAVITLCNYEGIPLDLIQEQLKLFKGVKRRFNERAFHNQIIVDDYAHHPTEVIATIDAAKQKYPDREVVAIFQPHTYSRTKTFLDEFASSLALADAVYLCDIFGSARENDGTLSIEDLKDRIPNANLISEETITCLRKHEEGVLIFMGAGDIQKYQDRYEKSVM